LDAAERYWGSVVVLLNGEAGQDRTMDRSGLGREDVELPSHTDEAAARTSSALADDSPGGSEGARVGPSCSDPGIESGGRGIVIVAGCHDEGELKLEGTGSSCVDVGSQSVAEEELSIPSAAAQATVAEGFGANRRRSRAVRRAATVDGDDTGTDAAPAASSPAFRRDESANSLIDPDGNGNFEGISMGDEEAASDGEAGEGVDVADDVAETAALLAVYLRRVQPSRESLNRRAQSAGAALLRSDLGSALFTRFVCA
jgi:hypothetical protein